MMMMMMMILMMSRLPHRLGCPESLPCQEHGIDTAEEAGPGGKASAPVFLFDTYVDAASIALKADLISPGGVRRVRSAVARFFRDHCVPGGRCKTDAGAAAGCNVVFDAGCAQLH